MSAWIPVTVPVEAKVGPVHLRLFPYESVSDYEGDFARPYCWGAMCRVTFRFGRLVTTKKITQRYVYLNRGWPEDNRPTDAALAEGRATVLANLHHAITSHGVLVDGDDLEVIEEAA